MGRIPPPGNEVLRATYRLNANKDAHPRAKGTPAPKQANHEIWEAIPDHLLLPEQRPLIDRPYSKAHSLALGPPAPEDHKKEIWEAVPSDIVEPYKNAHRLAQGAPAPPNARKEIWEAIPPNLLQHEGHGLGGLHT
jgi:hypothetical protein